jgi:predicted amidohydrolase
MAVLRVALLQTASAGANPTENLNRGLDACRTAAANGADIAVFPELWHIGYQPCPDDPEGRRAWQAQAIEPTDPWLEAFRDQARKLDMAIVVTYLQRWPGAPRNTATLIDRTGHQVAAYAKVHTCDFSMEAALTPGDAFAVAALDTRHGTIQVGMMICYDREFPESARVLMLEGAEIILVPNACDLTEDRIGQFRSRAFENMTAVAMANYPSPQYNGHSCAFDGVAFTADGKPRDHKIFEAGSEPGVMLADVDLDLLRDYRASESWGDAYRKPYAYQPLLRDRPRPPFIRDDARRHSLGR